MSYRWGSRSEAMSPECSQTFVSLHANLKNCIEEQRQRLSSILLARHGAMRGAELLRAHGGCLGATSRRRAWKAAISHGEPSAGINPWIPEWGNPPGVM